VLLNGPSVAQLIGAGDLARLPLALENGRRTGMVPLTDALVGFVQSGAVDVREAWRRAPDRPGLLKALKREGIDTSFAERLA
jgi:Tfp pilus assembly ATPase PilU